MEKLRGVNQLADYLLGLEQRHFSSVQLLHWISTIQLQISLNKKKKKN